MKNKTVGLKIIPLSFFGPGGGLTQPVGVPKQPSSSGTRSSTSSIEDTPRPGSTKTPVLQPVSPGEGKSYRRGKSETPKAVAEKDPAQS